MRYRIQDWAGNVLDYTGVFMKPNCAAAMDFNSFEDGWDWIYININDEEAYQELYVVEVQSE